VLGLLLAVQWQVARTRDLFNDGLTPEVRRLMPFRLWAIPAACVVALTAAFAYPEYSQSAFVATLLAGRVASRKS
jgi:hypothetical protein